MINVINNESLEEATYSNAKVIVYGESGVGTSTLCSTISGAVIVPIKNRPKLKKGFILAEPVQDLKGLYATLTELKNECFETIIIDDLSSLELLVWDYTCQKYQKPEIEAFGYGQGYSYALTVWRKLLDLLDSLNKNIILIGKAVITNVVNFNGAYNYADLAIDKKAKTLIQGWCDKCYFLALQQKVAENGEKYVNHTLFNIPSIYYWSKGNDSTEELNLNEVQLICKQE